jgi:hypothetical protein
MVNTTCWIAREQIQIPDWFTPQYGDCPAAMTTAEYPFGFLCLRDIGHPGRHISLGPHLLMAAWPGSHQPTRADLDHVVCDCPCTQCVDSHCSSCQMAEGD